MNADGIARSLKSDYEVDDWKIERELLIKRVNETLNFKKQLFSARKRKQKLEEYIKDYVHFLDREVKDMYLREAVEPLGQIIIYDGTEQGGYWTYDEFVSGKKNFD